MIYIQLRKKFLGICLATIALIFVVGLFFASDAFTATTNYTVCSSGCDFTTLADALNDPGLDGDSLIDTVTLTADYVFDYDAETVIGTDFVMDIPSGVTVSCDSGADTLGDKNQTEIELFGSTNVTIQNCLTENVKISLFGDNVNLLGNTFSSETDSWITLTTVDGYEISGNTGIQRLQLQGADNGLIENNNIECRFSGCVNVVTAGAPDYNNPPSIDANICNNVLINNNNIINYATGNIGDWVLVNGGKNIQFTNNTISSAVIMNDVYMTLVTVQNAQAEFTGNYIIISDEVSTTTPQATWPFNIRVDEYHVDVLYENNTVYGKYGNDICIGLFDGVNDPSINVDITANYNLCYNSSSTVAGSAISFSYDAAPGNANVTLTDSFNGLYNFTSPYITDDSGVITALNSNTVTLNPFLRTANVSTADDYYPSPISRYYDVDGTKDIGAHSGARVTNYLIDDDCIVDYATCFSTTTNILNAVISTGDTVNIATGTYDFISLDSPVNNVTFIGAGASTIFDAGGSGSTFSLENISNSDFSYFQVQGSNSNVTTTYTIDHAQYTDGINTYDEAVNLGAPDQSVLVITSIPSGNTCDTVFYDADDFDITTYVGSATSNWNLGLINYLNFAKITVLMPDNIVSSGAQLTGCSDPGNIVVDHFLNDVYTVNDGIFTYNSSAVATAGLSIKPGDTNPPAITRTVVTEESGGLLFNNSSGNTFSNVTSTDNGYAIVFKGSSASNIIKDSTLLNSTNGDLLTVGSGNNFFEDVLFDRTTVDIMGSGNMDIKYSVRAYIKDTASNALSGAEVSFVSANSLDSETLTTVGSGFTPFSSPLLAYTLTSSSLLEVNGGYNPYNITASLDKYNTKTMSVKGK